MVCSTRRFVVLYLLHTIEGMEIDEQAVVAPGVMRDCNIAVAIDKIIYSLVF
jgi:hypothetical protein